MSEPKTIRVLGAGGDYEDWPNPRCVAEDLQSPPAKAYSHPTTIQEFESVYREEYAQALKSCDKWIKWCAGQGDTHGINFHQGMRSAHIFNNHKMEQLLRVLKQEPPNTHQ